MIRSSSAKRTALVPMVASDRRSTLDMYAQRPCSTTGIELSVPIARVNVTPSLLHADSRQSFPVSRLSVQVRRAPEYRLDRCAQKRLADRASVDGLFQHDQRF